MRNMWLFSYKSDRNDVEPNLLLPIDFEDIKIGGSLHQGNFVLAHGCFGHTELNVFACFYFYKDKKNAFLYD